MDRRFCIFFFFNDPATTEIYTLSLHDALPISIRADSDLGIDGVVVLYKGAVVFEEYLGKWDSNDIHSTRSASKALTSALVGVAIDKNFLEIGRAHV